MDNLDKLIERSVKAQESTVQLVDAMKWQNKEMNDRFILHCQTASDTNKELKDFRIEFRENLLKWAGWAIKIFIYVAIVAILGLMGVNQLPKILELL